MTPSPKLEPLTSEDYRELIFGMSHGMLTHEYLRTILPVIDKGMARTAFLLRVQGYEPTVLKVQADDPANIQTPSELVCALESADHPLVPDVYQWGPPGTDPTWAEMEYAPEATAEQFERLAGVSWPRVASAFYHLSVAFDGAGEVLHPEDAADLLAALGPEGARFGQQVAGLIAECDLDPADLTDPEHWGVGYDGGLKVLDLGLLSVEPTEATKQRLLAW